MDRLYESALRSLKKSQNEKRLLQILHMIRKNITTANSTKNLDKIRKLQKEGCVKILVQNLKEASTNQEIINIILSIIGYACLHSDVAKEIIKKYQVLPILCKLMETHNVDSINGRIFRIIGNLCDGWNSNIVIEDTPQICKPLKLFFKELCEEDEANPKSSPATISMALRASRKLLKKNTSLIVLSDEKILKDVGAVFIKYSKLWIETRRNESILEDILKVIQHYSTFTKAEIVSQLRITSAGDSLAFLPDLIPLNPQRIMRIVMNLTMFCPNKSDLPILSMMNKLNHLALTTFERDLEQHVVYLQCLSNLLDHPGHREYVTKAGTVDVLLNLFSRHNVPSRHSVACLTIILNYLKKLLPDQSLIQLLLNDKVGPNRCISKKTAKPPTNNETVDRKSNTAKRCRCTLKRDHNKSECTLTYNFRRSCNRSNCDMKLSDVSCASNTADISNKVDDQSHNTYQTSCTDTNVDNLLLRNEDDNFLKLLIAKLRWLEIKTSKIYLPEHAVVKRTISLELIDGICIKEEDSLKSGLLDLLKEDTEGYFRTVYSTQERCASPSTSSDISSNGPYSPYRIITNDDEDSNSDDYSPICSDVEDSETPQLADGTPILRDFNKDCDATNSFEENYSKDLRNGIVDLCCDINYLLNSFVVQKASNFQEKMANLELCRILLNSSFRYIRPALKTVTNIVNSRSVLTDFMFTDFILEVFEFTLFGHKDCTICDRAKEHCRTLLQHCTNIIQDVTFKPNLVHRIMVRKRNGGLSASLIMTAIILVSGNYILKKDTDPISLSNVHLLKRILVNNEGCDLLMSSLRSPTLLSLHCLCKLVSTVIKIKNPRVHSIFGVVKQISITYDFKSDDEKRETDEAKEDDDSKMIDDGNCKEKQKNKFVTFILDDDTKIRTYRELLIAKSDYFSRLLEGDFIESNQSEIRLKNVKRRSFQFLIHLLSFNLAPPCTFSFRYLYLDIILDVILMADLYLLPDIACALTTYIEQRVLSSANVLEIYSWSLNSHTNLLRIEVVAYLMSKEVQDQRVPMLQKFIDAGLWDTLLDDIASLVTRHVQNL